MISLFTREKRNAKRQDSNDSLMPSAPRHIDLWRWEPSTASVKHAVIPLCFGWVK